MLNVLSVLIFSTAFAQERISAVLYDLNSRQKEKLYTQSIEITPEAESTKVQTIFRDLQGKTVVEESSLVNGVDLKEYAIQRPQTSEKGLIRVREGRVYFEYEGPDGKIQKDDEKLKGQILCSANFSVFVRAHWEELMAGQALSIRFAVWDRRETVGFTLQKVAENEVAGMKTLELRMKPSSFVIAALVDPLHFWFALDGKRLLRMTGRVSPKKQVSGHWKDLDAETLYTYDQIAVSK